MTENYQIKPLEVNKVVVFRSPIEGDDTLVRTGTIADGSCFVKDTKVYTTSGVKNIQDVKVGDKVITHTGNIKPVTQVHTNPLGDRKIHKLKIYKTREINVTDNHRFYAVERIGVSQFSKPKWIETCNLTKHHYVMNPKYTGEKDTNYMITLMEHLPSETDSWKYVEKPSTIYRQSVDNPDTKSVECFKKWVVDLDFCFFLGIWYGLGYFEYITEKQTKRVKGICFDVMISNRVLINFIKLYGKKLFGLVPIIERDNNKKICKISFNNFMIAEVFMKLFDSKTLPEFIHYLNKDYTKYLLAGLVTTTGTVETTLAIYVYLKDKEFTENLYYFIRSRGIDCNFRYLPTRNDKINGVLRLPVNSVPSNRIWKVYPDDRLRDLVFADTSTSMMKVEQDGNMYLNVTNNNLAENLPKVVYTLGVKGDNSYCVEGVIAENCFYHSISHSNSKKYISMTENKRKSYIKKLRYKISESVDKEKWESIGDGLVSKIPMQEHTQLLLKKFYRDILTENKESLSEYKNIDVDKNMGLFKLLCEVIPFEAGFEQKIFPLASHKSENGKIADYKKKVIDETCAYIEVHHDIKNLPKEKSDYIQSVIKKVINMILDSSENVSYKKYIQSLRNTLEFTDMYSIGLISDYFNRDIYILNSNNRMPYRNCSSSENLKGRKSILLIWVNNNHYEVVGRLLPKNKVQREFKPDDPLIKKLYTFMASPDEIKDKYPELEEYLPYNYRKISPPLPSRNRKYQYSDSECSSTMGSDTD